MADEQKQNRVEARTVGIPRHGGSATGNEPKATAAGAAAIKPAASQAPIVSDGAKLVKLPAGAPVPTKKEEAKSETK